MTSVLILGFLVGVLVVTGVTNLLGGIRGYKQFTCGIKAHSALVAFWGWLALVGSVLLWHIAPMATHPRAAFVAVAAGVFVYALVMSLLPKKASKK